MKRNLRDITRRSYGFKSCATIHQLGTKGDVQTFFWVCQDLIKNGTIPDEFKTITEDLYATLVCLDNFNRFEVESAKLKEALSKIRTKSINWPDYPYNRKTADYKYDYEKMQYDFKRKTLDQVFHRYFDAFEEFIESTHYWIEHNMDNPRLYMAMTEIAYSMNFGSMTNAEFIANKDNPLWLREISST